MMMPSLTFPRVRVRHGALLLAIFSVLLVSGCSQPTAEERLEMAYDKLHNQRPRDPLGATIILKDITRQQDADPDTRLTAFITLAELYGREFREFDRALDYTKGAIDAFGIDSERGQVAAEAQIGTLSLAGKNADALSQTQALLGRDDLPVPRRTRLRLRETSLLIAEGSPEEGRNKLEAMALEFAEEDLEKLALESLVQTFLPDQPTSGAEAYLRFAEAKPDSPLSAQARFGAGILLMQAGDKERAQAYIDEFIEHEKGEVAKLLNPDEKNARSVSLAKAMQMAGRVDEERAVYEQLVKDNPGNAVAIAGSLEMMAASYLRIPEFDNGIACFERVVAALPGTPQAERAAQIIVQLQGAKLKYEEQLKKVEAALGAETAEPTAAPADPSPAPTEAPGAATPEAAAAPETVAPVQEPATEAAPAVEAPAPGN